MEFKLSFRFSRLLCERELYASLYNHAALWSETSAGSAVFPYRAVKSIIERNFDGLNRKSGETEKACEFDKWLYDNHHIITSALLCIESDNKRFKKLPYYENAPRVFLFCRHLLKATDCNINEKLLDGAIEAFQKRTYFDYEELVYLPLAFRCAACEYIAALIKRRAACDGKEDGQAKTLLFSKYSASAASAITFLREAGNILRYDSVLKHSILNSVLSGEKSGVYPKMREDSKGDYLAEIARLSSARNICETDIARAAVSLADGSAGEVKNHAGYYLLREGRRELLNLLYGEEKKGRRRPKLYQRLYIAACLVVAAALCLPAAFFLGAPWFYIYPAVSFPVFIHIAKLIVTAAVKPFFRPDILPKMDFTSGVPGDMKTAVVTSVLAASPSEMEKAVKNLAANSFADRDGNIAYALLVDFVPSESGGLSDNDNAVIEAAQKALDDLKSINKNSVSIFFRRRKYNGKDKKWAGWERKRGAIMELCEYYLKRTDNFYTVLGDKSFTPRFIAAFDADTAAPPKAVTGLIETAAHPLNLAYNVFVPRIRTNILTTKDNLFTRLYADSPGFDAYANTMLDVYQDLFRTGIFHGKGLFRLKEFYERLDGALPENRILSHDLIEGAYSSAANVKTSLYDAYPDSYSRFLKRNLRWIRGDWQLLPYILPRVKDQSGKRRKNPIQPINKWQIFDNVNYSLMHAASLPLILISPFLGMLFWVPLCTAAAPFLITFFTDILVAARSLFYKKRLVYVLRDIWRGFLRLILNLVFLPHYAVCVLTAIIVTAGRLITKKNLLIWNTFAHTAKTNGKRERGSGKGERGNGKYSLSETEEDKRYLLGIAERTWRFFSDTLTAEYNFLPCDNFQEEGGKGFAPRTSPTNIGFGLLAAASAAHFGFITRDEAVRVIGLTLKTVKKLPKYRGHLYNWYDVRTLKTLWPDYVSSVDSGNFCSCLIAARGFLSGEKEKIFEGPVSSAEGFAGAKDGLHLKDKNCQSIIAYIDSYLDAVDFSCLYDAKRHLFRIGYNESANRLSDSHYDLLASESHLLSLTAIALGKIEHKNWSFLSRAFVRYKGVSLRAWTGGMFEYLMASLLVSYKPGTLVYESNLNAARGQIKFARSSRLPLFGVSESQYNLTDNCGNYQYRAFGVNAVSLKSMGAHKVISPYSSFLALEYLPGEALKNLRRAESCKLLSDKYGFYEAADFTEGTPAVIKSWMAHHQGMILCALDNYLNGGLLKKYFCGDSRIAAASLYITEKAFESKAPRKKLYKARETNTMREEAYFAAVNPKEGGAVNLLSGGKYHVVLDERGCGYSVFDGVHLTRSRPGKAESCGFRFFVLSLDDGAVFDSFKVLPARAVYRLSESIYTYEWQRFIITMTAAVSPSAAIELRKITVMNRGDKDADLRVASYFEPVLCGARDDAAHPVFSNLFVSTSFSRDDSAVTAARGNRAAPLLIHCAAGLTELECETNRFNFFDRGSGEPKCIFDAEALPKNTGFVLEPCVSLRGRVRVAKKSEADVSFFTGAAWNGSAAHKLTTMMNSVNFSKSLIMQARENAEAERRRGKNNPGLPAAVREMANKLLFSSPSDSSLMKLAQIRANLQSLYMKGINPGYPVYVYNVKDISDCKGLKTALEAASALYKFLIKFNFCITYTEAHGYDKPLYDALNEAVDSAGLRERIGADGGIVFYNLAAEYFESAECLRLIAAEQL